MALIVPSILAANFARLADEIHGVERGGASMIHIDIMDGHFVPNLTMGPALVESIRKVTTAEFAVHQEACVHLHRTLQLIRTHGMGAGVVLNPATPISTLEDVLDLVDHVLI